MKPKTKYSVFLLEIGEGCYSRFRYSFIHNTFAVSEKQAINNISFRTGIPKVKYIGDYLEEGHVIETLRACPADESQKTIEEWKNKYD